MTTTPAPSLTTTGLTGTTVGPFATGWKYAEAADVRVSLILDGVEGDRLTLDDDYTLTASAPLTSGGTVTLSSAVLPAAGWPSGATLVLRRRTARRQATAFPDTEGHKPRSTEVALDKAMRIAQEDRDDLDRAMVSPPGETGLKLPIAADRAGRFLTFDDDGLPRVVERPEDFTVLDKASVRLDNLEDDAAGGLMVTAPTGGAGVTLAKVLDLYAPPEGFGAQYGVLSALDAQINTQKLRDAINSGRMIDGGGRTYDFYGELRPTLACRLRNIVLRQRSTLSTEKQFLLDGLTAPEISFENVVLDCAGLVQAGGMAQARGMQISSYAGRLVINGLAIINGDAISAIELVGLTAPEIKGLKIRDFYPVLASAPIDDVCQGLVLTGCTNAVVAEFDIADMVASWPSAPSVRRQFSRGIAVGTSTGGVIRDGRVRNVEQGIDLTGGAYSYRVAGNLIVDAGTWGVKCANRFNDITIEGNEIIRPGNAGVVLSAPGDNTGVQPSRVTVRNNTIKDPGASGLWPAGSDSLGARGPAGIKVNGRSVAVAGYPAGVRIVRNTIEDSQSVKTMVWGVDVTTATSGDDVAFPAASNVAMVEEFDNTIIGWTAAGGRQRGCQYHRCGLSGTGSLTIPNNTWTAVPFTAASDRDDTAAMHDPTTNASFVTVREDGLYQAKGFVSFDNVSGGVRGLRFRVAGGNAFGQERRPSAGPANGTEISATALIAVKAGQRVELEAFQDSGSSVSQPLTGATLDLVMVQRGV
jgi:hypothetical protein